MEKTPRPAKIFITLISLLGIGLGGYALSDLASTIASGRLIFFVRLFVLVVLGTLAGDRRINLTRKKDPQINSTMSLGFVLVFLTMIYLETPSALLVTLISNLFTCRRQQKIQILFNLSLSLLEVILGGFVFYQVNGQQFSLSFPKSIGTVVMSSLTFFLVNTVSVSSVIVLCAKEHRLPIGKEIYDLWRETFLWTAPSYFAGATVSAIALTLFTNLTKDKESFFTTAGILLFIAPVAYLTYQSYAIYTNRSEERLEHIEELQKKQEELADLYLATIRSMALAIDAKDQYTHQHIIRVQRYAVAIAKKMGLTGNDLKGIETGALLHDIGKLGVPEYVLLKPGKLNSEEFAKIKKHPELGASILAPVHFPWPVLDAVKYHHEKWDGTGYPEGLKGEDIPLPGRILAVADVYDALTSSRSYRSAWTHERAIEVIREGRGTHFDSAIADVFLEIIEEIVEEMATEGIGPLAIASTGTKVQEQTLADKKAAQAVRDIQRASSELWALYEVAQTLSSSLGLQETLEILGRKLEAFLPGVTCVFLMQNAEKNGLVVRSAVGVNLAFFQEAYTSGPTSLSERVVASRETYRGVYDTDDLMLVSVDIDYWREFRSSLIVPIIHQGAVLGTINLYHERTDNFTPYDQQLLELIMERAAMALYNGLLFERTRSHANTDSLTGLHNIRYFSHHVETRCLQKETPFALLCLDLDSFKPINDIFGHQQGDQVLCDLADILRKSVGVEDVVARYGGDEFVIVLEGASQDRAVAVTNLILKSVQGYRTNLIHPRVKHLRLGVSIGHACFPEEGHDCATLIAVADNAMYANKAERKLERLSEASAPVPLRRAA